MTRFADTVGAEWIKLTTVRSTYVTAALGLVLAGGLAVLTGIVIGVTWDDWEPSDRAEFEPVLAGFAGLIFAGLLFTVVSVTSVTREYASGLIRLTLTATPRRGRVLLAKAAVVTVAMWAASAACTLLAFALAQAAMASYGLETASLADGDTLRTLATSVALAPVYPLIGLSLGFILRSTAAAITSVLALIFAPGVVGALLPAWWQDHVLVYEPGAAGDSLSLTQVDDSVASMPPLVALAVVAGWLALFLGAAYLALVRRDA